MNLSLIRSFISTYLPIDLQRLRTSDRSWWRSVAKTELSFFIGRSGWQPWLPPPSIFLPSPRFLPPRVTIINTPIHWDLISLSRKAEILFIKSHPCPYCIILYDIPDWSMNIWFSPSDSFVTNFDVSLNCHKFHISAFCSIPANFPITGTHVSSFKVKIRMVTFSEIGIQLSGKVDFLWTRTFWSIIGCLRALNISNIHKVLALPSIKALSAGGQM